MPGIPGKSLLQLVRKLPLIQMFGSPKRAEGPRTGEAAARPGPAHLLAKRVLKQLSERSYVRAGDFGPPTARQQSTGGAAFRRDSRLPAPRPDLLGFRRGPGAARGGLIRSIQQRPRTLRDIWSGRRKFGGPCPLQDLIRPGRGRPASMNRGRGLRRDSRGEKCAQDSRRDRRERSHQKHGTAENAE